MMMKSSTIILILAAPFARMAIKPVATSCFPLSQVTPSYSRAFRGLKNFGNANFYWTRKDVSNISGEQMLPQDQVLGILTIIAMPDPDPEKLYGASLSTKQQIDLGDFKADEWEAIFYQVLHCPVAADEPSLPNENEEDWQVRFSQKFQQAIPEYPNLAEIWNLQIYISYEFEEVKRLRSECINLRSSTSNKKARTGLTKLIKACDEAIKYKYGLLFVPD